MDRAKILERIRACLALGDSNRNPSAEEAATAVAMAQKLMAEHNLSMADVAFSEANTGKIREEQMRPRSGIPKWEIDLSRVCDHLFGTKHFLKECYEEKKFKRNNYSNDHTYKKSVVFYGYDIDVALSVEVYKLLKLEILGMARRWELKEAAENSHMTPGEVRGRRFAYCDGIVWTLIARAGKEAENLSKKDAAKVRDLVVRKDMNLDNWAHQQHPDLHPVRRRETGRHEDATYEGNAAGDKMSLNFKNVVKNTTSSAPLALEKKP